MDTLKLIMRLNATSCILFGALFVLIPGVVASFLGQFPSALVVTLGIALLGNGALLIAASSRKDVQAKEVIFFSIGDFGWWLATLGFVVSNFWITTTLGVVVSVIIATGVAILGVLQMWVLGVNRHHGRARDHFQAIVKSWQAMPLWVRVWLFIFNGVFLSAFIFASSRVAEVTLTAFNAAVPLVIGMLGYDGGLRRILAAVHLLVWSPLLVWLVFVPEPSAYGVAMGLVLAICLAFDVNDVRLHLAGDRKVFGT